MSRYSRQEVLPQIGKVGQERLGKARVAVVGLGALGSVAASLLARAGVGHLRLIDRDVVELSNLQRQALFTEADLDRPKAVVGRERLVAVNSEITIEAFAKDVNVVTAEGLLTGVDLLLDGTDNMETRLLVNDVCLKHGLPWVYAGAVATHGMVMALVPGKTACFRCFVPSVPAPGTLETCDTAGIVATTSTTVASMQVTEGLRLLLGEPPSGKILAYEGWTHELRALSLAQRKDCPACVQGRRDFLEVARSEVLVALCGRNAMSLDPLREDTIPLEAIAARLRGIGKVREADGVLVAEVDPYVITLFSDGRAVIRGTDDPAVARSVYARYVGA